MWEADPVLLVASAAVAAVVAAAGLAVARRARRRAAEETVPLDTTAEAQPAGGPAARQAPARGASADPAVQEAAGAPERPTGGAEGPAAEARAAPSGAPEGEGGALGRFLRGLARTREQLGRRLGGVFGRSRIDEDLYEALEEALLGADVGVATTERILRGVRDRARKEGLEEPEALRAVVADVLRGIFEGLDPALAAPPGEGPLVVLVVGVNGSGKTTTIGKLAARFGAEGRKVLVGAGDTFRAGAIEQLRIWTERAGADFVAHKEGADAAAVLHDAIAAGRARGADVILCDTAGRLQARRPLMEELAKVRRVVGRALAGAPHEVLLVLDATIGQNALSQARTFGEVAGVTGVVLTKLDGTARGGVVVAVASELGLPIKFIGIGEGVEDLRPFDAEAFIQALLAEEPDPPAAARGAGTA